MNGVLIAIAVVGGTGIILGILLGIAGDKFAVEVDEKEVAVRAALPGNNCGGCGFPGCDGLAAAIAKGEAKPNACPVGGAPVAEAIASIMGVEAEEVIKRVAVIKCAGDCEKAKDIYEYVGPKDCRLAGNNPNGGAKGCTFGCLGFGNCIKVCEHGAISIVNGIAVVDKEKCGGCGQCAAECPRGLIEMVPYDLAQVVSCNSKDKGVDVKKVCSAGCIGCMLCAKNCSSEAITVENNLAHIDPEKCINCGNCVEKCPVKIIKKH